MAHSQALHRRTVAAMVTDMLSEAPAPNGPPLALGLDKASTSRGWRNPVLPREVGDVPPETEDGEPVMLTLVEGHCSGHTRFSIRAGAGGRSWHVVYLGCSLPHPIIDAYQGVVSRANLDHEALRLDGDNALINVDSLRQAIQEYGDELDLPARRVTASATACADTASNVAFQSKWLLPRPSNSGPPQTPTWSERRGPRRQFDAFHREEP